MYDASSAPATFDHPRNISAADQGHAAAQYVLSSMYEEGDGVNQSDRKAREWAMRAEAGGHLEAQIVGALHQLSEGGKRSEVRRDPSLFLFSVAACRSSN